jgi:hypothetical protein
VLKKRVPRGCHKNIVLWSSAVDPVTREVREAFRCPHCDQQWKKIQLTRDGDIPVFTVVEFVGRTPSNKSARLKRGRDITATEKQLLAVIARQEPKRFFPNAPIDPGREMMRHGLLARGLTNESAFYSPRLLHGLSAIWERVQATRDDRVRRALQFTFTAIVHRCSKLNRLRPSGAGDPLTGTLYIGSLWRENHALDDFSERVEALFNLAPNLNSGCVMVTQGSATSLRGIPDNSVDYVFADPPFGSNIFYADCSMLWESWLGDYMDENEEMVVSDRRVGGPFKALDDYANMMAAAIQEVYRVLKPGRWTTIEFNNSDGRVFEAIKHAVLRAGFQIANMLLFDKAQKSFKQVKGAKGEEDVVDKDVLFNLHKPAAARAEVRAEDHDLEQQVADAVRKHLQELPDRIKVDPAKYNDEHRTTATINSMLMNTLIPRGVGVERLNLPFIDRVCARYFHKVGQQWYLRGEAVGANGAEGLFAEEVAIADDLTAIGWLRQKLHVRPMLMGEIKPLWMRATGLLPAEVSHTLILEDLLAENFWRDLDTNRWREPTEEERKLMSDDRSLRVLHDAERFNAGSLRRATTDSERCEWIDVLFRACKAVEEKEPGAMPVLRGFDEQKGYVLISRLFQSVLKDNVEPRVFQKAEKQARVASQRLNKALESEQERVEASKRKERGPTLFDGVKNE